MDPKAITADHLGQRVRVTSTEDDGHSVVGTLARVTHYRASSGDGIRTKMTIITVGGLMEIEAGDSGRGDRFTISMEI